MTGFNTRMRLSLFLTLFAMIALVHGRFLTDAELEEEVCNSQVSGIISRVSVVSVPAQPIDIIVIDAPAEKFEVSCIRVFEIGPTLLPSQRDLCDDPPVLNLCTSPAEATERVWTCRDISNYNTAPRTSTTLGAFNEPKFYYKITWMPVNMGVACFPRDLTTQFVGTALKPAKSSVAAVVAFIIIACLAALLVVFFASYQLRKQLQKFWKREMLATRHMPEQFGQVQPAEADQRAQSYYNEEEVIAPRGKQQTVIEGVTVSAHPLPKKWYERYNYREEDPAQAGSVPRPVHQPTVYLPESINVTATQGQVSRSPIRDLYGEYGVDDAAGPSYASGSRRPMPLYDEADDAEPTEWVKMCGDCRLVIDANAPQFCEMSGLRHY